MQNGRTESPWGLRRRVGGPGRGTQRSHGCGHARNVELEARNAELEDHVTELETQPAAAPMNTRLKDRVAELEAQLSAAP